jgi:hypothetical protein
MTFLGQVELPDSELTRRLLTWEITLFLFANVAELEFKVVEQDTTAQTAEEHYRNEDNGE